VEDRNFEIRKHLLDYDDVLNEQRNYLYSERDTILSDENLLLRVRESCHEIAVDLVDEAIAQSKGQPAASKIVEAVEATLHLRVPLPQEQLGSEEYKRLVIQAIDDEIDAKVAITGEKPFNDFLRFNYLRQVDLRWQDHLTALEELRESVSLRTYAQKNPLVEYKVEGFEIFTEMLDSIRLILAQTLVRVQIKADEHTYRRARSQQRMEERHSSHGSFAQGAQPPPVRHGVSEDGSVVTVRRATPKVGRNDPCPCGSGKKYKHCHGR